MLPSFAVRFCPKDLPAVPYSWLLLALLLFIVVTTGRDDDWGVVHTEYC